MQYIVYQFADTPSLSKKMWKQMWICAKWDESLGDLVGFFKPFFTAADKLFGLLAQNKDNLNAILKGLFVRLRQKKHF